MPDEKLDDKVHAELILLHQGSAEDTRDLKRQQWNITYYCALVLGAFVTYLAWRMVEKVLCEFEKGAMAIIGVLVSMYGQYYLARTQASLLEYRTYADRVQRHFSPVFKQCSWRKQRFPRRWYRHGELVVGMAATLIVGALIVVWVALSDVWYLLVAALVLILWFCLVVVCLKERTKEFF